MKIEKNFGGNYNYIIGKLLSFPILIIVLKILSDLPTGKSNNLIYSVILVGTLVNGTIGQSILQHGFSSKKSTIIFTFNFTIIEFLLIALTGIFNGLNILANKSTALVVLAYVFFRVITMILTNNLYQSKHYIQSLNFIFSKVIDLFLVYYIYLNINHIDLLPQDPSIKFNLLSVILLLLISLTNAYLNFKKLFINMVFRLPVSLLYLIFSFLFFNFAADLVKVNSSYLLRLKGLFDVLASIVSVTSLKENILKRPLIKNFPILILFNIFSSFIIHYSVILGLVFFSLAAIFSAKIYSRTIIIYGVFWYSFAWSLSLLTAISIILFNANLSIIAYAVCESLPLIIIYLLDFRLKRNG